MNLSKNFQRRWLSLSKPASDFDRLDRRSNFQIDRRYILLSGFMALVILAVGCGRMPQSPTPTRAPIPTFTPTFIPSPTLATTAPLERCPEIERGLAFLKARFNPELGLLNEAPNAAPHTYWLTNDNALAAVVLERLGEADLSAAVRASLERYGGSGGNGLIEAVWGQPVEFPPYDVSYKPDVQVGEDVIRQELHTSGNRYEDWAEYANLAFLGALNAYNRGDPTGARGIFSQAMGMFDGIGFHDKVFDTDGKYETYKLALALYTGTVIGAPDPEAERMHAILLSMQTPEGGFTTHYRVSGQAAGDANTETTSLALLALSVTCR